MWRVRAEGYTERETGGPTESRARQGNWTWGPTGHCVRMPPPGSGRWRLPCCVRGKNSKLSPLLCDTHASRHQAPVESIWLARPRPRAPSPGQGLREQAPGLFCLEKGGSTGLTPNGGRSRPAAVTQLSPLHTPLPPLALRKQEQ